MWKTVLFLIFTLIVVPVLTFRFDTPLTGLQQETLHTLLYVYGGAALLCFIVSSLTANYSQVISCGVSSRCLTPGSLPFTRTLSPG